MSSDSDPTPVHPGPLEAHERRVLGVLVEKAKTTPSAYPLSLNALRSGCNQKSNRFPQTDLDEEQLERVVDSLRERGALTVVQSDSRTERYRHRLYEWLGLEKAELAVVAELLCRGAQTVGDLRGRAARMEPIAGMSELRPILDSLVQKGYVAYLTPQGRGAIVTHTFYKPEQLDRVRRDLGITGDMPSQPPAPAPESAPPAPVSPQPVPSSEASVGRLEPSGTDFMGELISLRDDLTAQIDELKSEVERLRQRVEG